MQPQLQMLMSVILVCLLMPLAGGSMLYAGFHSFKIDRALSTCLKAFGIAAGSAYLLMIVLGPVIAQFDRLAGVVVTACIVSLVEMMLIAVLVRKLTSRALLVEAASVLLTNAIGYSAVISLAVNSAPVLAGR